jgi:flagellar hook protein FlgE
MGMAAQTAMLGTVAENIANSSTVGYKESTTQFSTLLTSFAAGSGEVGGGVATENRIKIDAQGTPQATSSATDLSIQGAGFFVVSNAAGQTFLTRAGSFAPDSEGRLVNSAGYYLMGVVDPNGDATTSDVGALQVVTVSLGKLVSTPSTSGSLAGNLPSSAEVIAAANLPSSNVAGSSYTAKRSVTAYDNLGNAVLLDVYFSKTADNTWEMDVFDASGASAGGGFPYSSAPLATQALVFSASDGSLLSGSPASFSIPNGAALSLDVGSVTQLGAAFGMNASINGSAASAVSSVDVGSDGSLSYVLANGQTIPAYKIPLADVPSPYGLTAVSGNVFAANSDSGDMFVGSPSSGPFGKIASYQLEGSTVDLATQLSSMIIAQRSYTANSQVFQVASEVLQVLNNLK